MDVVAVIAFNDAFVMSAWGKANGIKNDDILFLSDPDSKFSRGIGWNMGERAARYAMIIDKGEVVYAEREPARDVTVSAFVSLVLVSVLGAVSLLGAFEGGSFANVTPEQVSGAAAILSKL